MTNEINWKFILNTIKSEKCVLLLGPEIISQSGKTLNKLLTEYLDIKVNKNILAYYEKDELFLFKDGMSKTMTYYEIKDFYSQKFADDIYEKIAQLPFNLIVSITPDFILTNTFKKLNLEHNFSFYNKNQNPRDIETPTKDIPLIYNLFGSLEQEESLILTHDDLFDFIFASMGSMGLPKELRNSLNNADNFIFLGFTFEKWYLQIILRLLNPKKEKYKFALNKEQTSETKSFYIEQFKVNFSEIEPVDFLNELFEKCKEQNILRNTGEVQASVSVQIASLVEKDEIEKAINKLKSFFEEKDQDMFNMTIGILSSFNRLKRKITSGIIDEKESTLEMNKIRHSILEMNNDVKDFEK